MKRKTLTERIEALERELIELKAVPKTEQHTHFHYPPAQYIPQSNPMPWRYPQTWWYASPTGGGQQGGTKAGWSINSAAGNYD